MNTTVSEAYATVAVSAENLASVTTTFKARETLRQTIALIENHIKTDSLINPSKLVHELKRMRRAFVYYTNNSASFCPCTAVSTKDTFLERLQKHRRMTLDMQKRWVVFASICCVTDSGKYYTFTPTLFEDVYPYARFDKDLLYTTKAKIELCRDSEFISVMTIDIGTYLYCHRMAHDYEAYTKASSIMRHDVLCQSDKAYGHHVITYGGGILPGSHEAIELIPDSVFGAKTLMVSMNYDGSHRFSFHHVHVVSSRHIYQVKHDLLINSWHDYERLVSVYDETDTIDVVAFTFRVQDVLRSLLESIPDAPAVAVVMCPHTGVVKVLDVDDYFQSASPFYHQDWMTAHCNEDIRQSYTAIFSNPAYADWICAHQLAFIIASPQYDASVLDDDLGCHRTRCVLTLQDRSDGQTVLALSETEVTSTVRELSQLTTRSKLLVLTSSKYRHLYIKDALNIGQDVDAHEGTATV